jgi:pimeloyl-ACP methyl ester carboxylesterase
VKPPRLGLGAGLGLAAIGAFGYAGLAGWSRQAWVADLPLRELELELDRWLAELGVSARHRYVHTTVGRVHVLDAGGGGDAVVLIPGLADSAGEFGAIIGALADRHRVVVIDRPGTGLSDPIGFSGHPRDAWIRVIATVADQLELGPFILAGHSLGGLAAGAFATAHPERVRRLVLVSPLGLERRTPLAWSLMLIPGVPGLFAASARAHWRGAIPRPWGASAPSCVSQGLSPMQAYLGDVALRFGPGSDVGALGRLLRPLSLHPESLLLPGLGLLADRTLVVWGSQDRRLPLAGARGALRHHRGLRLRVVEGAGHLLPYEQPELVAELIVGG